jgi:hypothetical protein
VKTGNSTWTMQCTNIKFSKANQAGKCLLRSLSEKKTDHKAIYIIRIVYSYIAEKPGRMVTKIVILG